MKIEGPLDRLLLDFKANLEGAELGWDERPIKLADQPGSLFLTGELTPGRLELSHGRLQMPPLEIRAQAHIDRSAETRFQCALDLAPLPLEQTLPFLPAMQRFALQGELRITSYNVCYTKLLRDSKVNLRIGQFANQHIISAITLQFHQPIKAFLLTP